MSEPSLLLSRTVESARSALLDFDRIPALMLAEEILALHPEYGGGLATVAIEAVGDALAVLPESSAAFEQTEHIESTESIESPEQHSGAMFTESDVESESADGLTDPVPTRTVDEWLFAVQELYLSDPPTRLHGRLVLLGLALIDETVRDALRTEGFLDELLGETSDFEERVIVSDWREVLVGDDAQSITDEGVPSGLFRESTTLLDDSPVTSENADLLDRKAFAEYLAGRLDALADARPDGRLAYSVHLSGDWGTGKTSVLNLLESELVSQPSATGSNRSRWTVIQFNAWRHQHIDPPWWALMDYVYRETKDKLGPMHRIEEWAWRWSRQRVQALAAGLVMALLFGGLLTVLLREGDVTSLSPELVGGLAGLIGVMWTVSTAMSKPLVLHSAASAEGYVKYATNPMTTIKERFKQLVERIPSDQVAVFIDDIDRCDSAYAVGLLEGMQTLFRGAPVVFVVAGDRHWIDTSFEEVYDAQARNHAVFGKSLGTLFTEKTFHLTAPIPQIGEALQTAFVDAVTTPSNGQASASSEDTAGYLATLETASDETVVLDVLERSADLPFEDQRTVRTAAVRRLGSPEVMAETEHVLMQFVPLLEPNPRGIKRLVNTYGVNRALTTLAHIDPSQNQLARWTILSMRWPDIADTLARAPSLLPDSEASMPVVKTDEETHRLLEHPDVRAVLDWKDEPLRAETVEQCARIWG